MKKIQFSIQMNRISILYCFCFFAMLFCLSGCKKAEWYDLKSDKSLAVPATLQDYQAMLNDLESLNRLSPGFGEAASDGHYMLESSVLILDAISLNAYTWSNEQPYVRVLDWMANGTGAGPYGRVFVANLVLEGLKKVIVKNETEAAQLQSIKGQALFLRGRSFYELSQVFANPYVKEKANNEMGIPLRLESDVTIASKRSTLKQTYDQVISDLNSASSLLKNVPLPTDALSKVRPGKVAVLGYLSRVFLSMREYGLAGTYADSCLNLYQELLDYNNTADVSLAATRPIAIFNREIIYHCEINSGILAVNLAILLVDADLYQSFSDNDLRKAGNFVKNATTGNITFKGTLTGNTRLFSGIASGELLLTRAECAARNGDLIAAARDMNTLLVKRWKTGTFTPLSFSNKEEAINEVLIERKKELMFRGLRWTDMRRLNLEGRFNITLQHTAKGKTYTLEPNSYKYTFPIPDDVMQNSSLEQNPGW